MTDPPHYILGVSGLAPGRHDLRASYSGDDNFHGSESTILTHHAFASSGLLIDARGRADGIVLAWPYMNDTTRQVGRAIAPDPAFTGRVSIGRATLDQQTSPGVVYLYRLEFWSGGLISGFGPVDLGVRMTFSEDPLLPGMKVRASHFQEVIDATNFLRGKVGQSLVTFNDLAAGTSIRASHITTLRTKINEARTALGAAPVSFIRAIASGDIIRAQDLQELREAVH